MEYKVSENYGKLLVNVLRDGDTSQSSTVKVKSQVRSDPNAATGNFEKSWA